MGSASHIFIPLVQGWGDQLSMQMELAGGLSGVQEQNSKTKASDWKLQCLHQPTLDSEDLERDPVGPGTRTDVCSPQAKLRIRTQPLPSKEEIESSTEARHVGKRSSKRLDRLFSNHQANHTSTTVSTCKSTLMQDAHLTYPIQGQFSCGSSKLKCVITAKFQSCSGSSMKNLVNRIH